MKFLLLGHFQNTMSQDGVAPYHPYILKLATGGL